MSQGRRHSTDEFKPEAVALLVNSGRPLSQIASELGISPSMLRNWRNGSGGRDAGSARHPIPASAPHSAPDPAAQISRLRRDTARRDLFAYIEGYYNRRRIHSAIGYITPQQAEVKYA